MSSTVYVFGEGANEYFDPAGVIWQYKFFHEDPVLLPPQTVVGYRTEGDSVFITYASGQEELLRFEEQKTEDGSEFPPNDVIIPGEAHSSSAISNAKPSVRIRGFCLVAVSLVLTALISTASAFLHSWNPVTVAIAASNITTLLPNAKRHLRRRRKGMCWATLAALAFVVIGCLILVYYVPDDDPYTANCLAVIGSVLIGALPMTPYLGSRGGT